MQKCDLHIHTTASDGLFEPEQVVQMASKNHVTTIAITDHDTVEGVSRAIYTGKIFNVKVIPGIEFSSTYKGKDVHILGYFIDYKNSDVTEFLKMLKDKREKRAFKIVQKLNRMGFSIEFDRVKEIAHEGSIGRPHIARALKEKGYIGSQNEAFHGIIGENDSAYVPKLKIEVKEAIKFLRFAKSVVVLAHPGLIQSKEIVNELLEFDFDGIEVYHPKHSDTDIQYFKTLSREHGLLFTGGSDFHCFHDSIHIGFLEFDCHDIASNLIDKWNTLYEQTRPNL